MNLNYPNLHQIKNIEWKESNDFTYNLTTQKEISSKDRYQKKKYQVDDWLIEADWSKENSKLLGYSKFTYRNGTQQHESYFNNSKILPMKIATSIEVYKGIIAENMMNGFGRFNTMDNKYSIEAFFYTSPLEYKIKTKHKKDQNICQVEITPQKISLTGKVTIFTEGNILWYEGNIADNNLSGVGTYYDKSGNCKYDGEILKGKAYGVGKFYENNKIKYQGKFEDNYFLNGTIFDVKNKYGNQPIFLGESISQVDEKTKQKKFTGYTGTYIVNDKTTHYGTFNNSFLQYGEGKRYSGDKLIMEGFFKNNYLIKGTYYYNNIIVDGNFEYNSNGYCLKHGKIYWIDNKNNKKTLAHEIIVDDTTGNKRLISYANQVDLIWEKEKEIIKGQWNKNDWIDGLGSFTVQYFTKLTNLSILPWNIILKDYTTYFDSEYQFKKKNFMNGVTTYYQKENNQIKSQVVIQKIIDNNKTYNKESISKHLAKYNWDDGIPFYTSSISTLVIIPKIESV